MTLPAVIRFANELSSLALRNNPLELGFGERIRIDLGHRQAKAPELQPCIYSVRKGIIPISVTDKQRRGAIIAWCCYLIAEEVEDADSRFICNFNDNSLLPNHRLSLPR